MAALETRTSSDRPQRTDYEEFLWTPVGTLRRYTDADGRPLCGEAVIDNPEFRASVEQRRCHYPGSRRDHPLPMNVSALKQITKNWDEILATANALRERFVTAPARRVDGLTLAMRVAYAGMCLPLFLLYRARDPFGNARVPGFVSGLHKASIDIATTVQLMLVESFQRADRRAPPAGETVASILDFVEREGLLIGPKGVCAGPPRLIREILEVMIHGQGRRLADGHGAVAALGDLSGADAYVDQLMLIWIGKHLVAAYNTRLIDALEARLREQGAAGVSAAEVHARIRRHKARESHPALQSQIVAREEHALRSLDAVAFRALLRTLDPAASTLAASLAQGECARRLLAHAGGGGENIERHAALTKLRGLVGGRVADAGIAALLDAAVMERLALRFFESTETPIRTALGLPPAARPLSTRDLDAVFGVLPRQYIGASIGIASEIEADATVFRTGNGVVRY